MAQALRRHSVEQKNSLGVLFEAMSRLPAEWLVEVSTIRQSGSQIVVVRNVTKHLDGKAVDPGRTGRHSLALESFGSFLGMAMEG